MTIILFSDKNFEEQAKLTIASIKNKINDDIRIVYYTIGFKSDFKSKNVTTHYIENDDRYPLYNFYKIDLCLKTMELYHDDYYFFTDVDVIFSKKVDFNKLKFNYDYPMASYGPVEFPITYRVENGETQIFNEEPLMRHCGVKNRTMRYVWSCIFAFNNSCKNFFEEVIHLFENQDLIKNHRVYFPYSDETAFNVCLWKRGVTNNLGHAFLNTHDVNALIKTEENDLVDYGFGCLDVNGHDWQFVHDSKKILAYHGFKDPKDMRLAADYVSFADHNILEKTLICVSGHIYDEKTRRQTIDIIKHLKEENLTVCYVTNSMQNLDEISAVSDYVLYDKCNTKMTSSSFINNSDVIDLNSDAAKNFYVTFQDFGFGRATIATVASHSIGALKLFKNSIGFSFANNFEWTICITYDLKRPSQGFSQLFKEKLIFLQKKGKHCLLYQRDDGFNWAHMSLIFLKTKKIFLSEDLMNLDWYSSDRNWIKNFQTMPTEMAVEYILKKHCSDDFFYKENVSNDCKNYWGLDNCNKLDTFSYRRENEEYIAKLFPYKKGNFFCMSLFVKNLGKNELTIKTLKVVNKRTNEVIYQLNDKPFYFNYWFIEQIDPLLFCFSDCLILEYVYEYKQKQLIKKVVENYDLNFIESIHAQLQSVVIN